MEESKTDLLKRLIFFQLLFAVLFILGFFGPANYAWMIVLVLDLAALVVFWRLLVRSLFSGGGVNLRKSVGILIVIFVFVIPLAAFFGRFLLPDQDEWKEAPNYPYTPLYFNHLLLTSSFLSPVVFLSVGFCLAVILLLLYRKIADDHGYRRLFAYMFFGYVAVSIITLAVLLFFWYKPLGYEYWKKTHDCTMAGEISGFEGVIIADRMFFRNTGSLAIKNPDDSEISIEDAAFSFKGGGGGSCTLNEETPVPIGPGETSQVHLSCDLNRYKSYDCLEATGHISYRTGDLITTTGGDVKCMLETEPDL